MKKSHDPVRGIISPLVTPVTRELHFDPHAYSRIIEHVIRGGVNGIFILGTTGEGASLNNEIRLQAIRTAVGSASGRLPVFINGSTPSFQESLKLSRMAAEEGADYVVLTPPFYFDINQEELYRFFETLASSSPLPVLLYNAPQYTKTEISLETVSRLARHENILGLKDSSGEMDYARKLLDTFGEEEFSIYVGPELLLAETVSLGAAGGVNGGANLFPELYVSMYQAALHGDMDKQEKLQGIIRLVWSQIYDIPDSPNGIIIGLKVALSILGLCKETMAMPVYGALSKEQKQGIEDFVKKYEKFDF